MAVTDLADRIDELEDENAALRADVARLREGIRAYFGTGPLGYEPLAEDWICDDHGFPRCEQTEACRALPWDNVDQPVLRQFEDWADRQFRRIMADVESEDDTPDRAFDAYWPEQWFEALAADVPEVSR